MQIDPMFTYNASALGLGGLLKRRGVTTVIPSLASVSLAPSGGEGSNEVLNYSKDGVSFASAKAVVVGTRSGRIYTTTSDVYLTHLNLFDRIKVDMMYSRVSSTRFVDPVEESELTEEKLIELGAPDTTMFETTAVIRGFRIDDIEIVPQFESQVCLPNNFTTFTNSVKGANRPLYANRFGMSETKLQKLIDSGVQPIRGTILKSEALDSDAPRDTVGRRTGYTLPVTGLGKVHLGEMIVKPNRRRVNLLRIDFNHLQAFEPSIPGLRDAPPDHQGGPDDGSMTVLSEDSNGVPIWG